MIIANDPAPARNKDTASLATVGARHGNVVKMPALPADIQALWES